MRFTVRIIRIYSMDTQLSLIDDLKTYHDDAGNEDSSLVCKAIKGIYEQEMLQSLEIMQGVSSKYKSDLEVSAELRLNSAIVYMANDNVGRGIEEAQQALEESDDVFIEVNGRAILIFFYLMLGQKEKASIYVPEIRLLLTTKDLPNYVHVFGLMAISKFLYETQQYDEAAIELGLLTKVATGFPLNSGNIMLGNIRLKRGDVTGLDLIRESIESTDNWESYSYLFVTEVMQVKDQLESMGLYEDANSLLTVIIDLWHNKVLSNAKSRHNIERQYLQGRIEIAKQRTFRSYLIAGFSGVALIVGFVIFIQTRRRNVVLGILNRALGRRNDEMRTMTYTVHHNFRGPIAYITTALELFEDQKEDLIDLDLEDAFDFLEGGVQRQVRASNGLRTYLDEVAKDQDELEKEEIIITELIHEADVSIGSIPPFKANRGQMETLFEHLINNARKYGGEKIRIYADGDNLVFEDDGGNFPADQETQERLFRPFQRGVEGGEGDGIGLSVMRGIANNHDLELSVHVGEGVYTRFILPCLK